jgi:hypothetical protein
MAARTISYSTPQRVIINSQGPFVNSNLLTSNGFQDFSLFSLDGTFNSAFILLHETRHLTHVFGNDANNDALIGTL